MTESKLKLNSVVRGLIYLCMVLVLGTLWFAWMEEGYTLLDGLYMTVITVSTVGFREVQTLDGSGRLFVVVLIISGLTVMTYTLGSVGRVIIDGSLQRFVGRHRMTREIEKFRDHYIVCGHGRMGNILSEELAKEKVPFVVVEGDQEEAERLVERGIKVVFGDATKDDVLERAAVRRAKGLVAVVSSNVDNLYITLSARVMCKDENPGLYILCRATDQQASEKIKRAGANRVISPYVIGGMRIVQALLRPTVYDFVDIATQSGGLDLKFEELAIGDNSRLNEVALKDSGIRADFDVIVIAIKKATGEMTFNPGPSTRLGNGDVLITLGDKIQMERLAASLR